MKHFARAALRTVLIFAAMSAAAQTTPLTSLSVDDLLNVEVTRGPGGTLWGANAMNGVINIVTKHPVDTQGTLANVSHGIADGPALAARFGGRFGNTGSYRAYLKTFDRPATHDALHASFNDQWSMFRGGFR